MPAHAGTPAEPSKCMSCIYLRKLRACAEPKRAAARRGEASQFFFFFFFLIPFIIFVLFPSLSPSVDVTQIQGYKAGSSSPSPLRYVPSFLSRQILPPVLPSSTRIETFFQIGFRPSKQEAVLLFFGSKSCSLAELPSTIHNVYLVVPTSTTAGRMNNT